MAKKVTKDELLDSLCAPLAKACREHKLTVSSVVKAVKDGLEACETKTNYDKDRGKWVYSTPLIDHGKRLDAASIASGWFGLKKPEKLDVKVEGFEEVLRKVHEKRTGKKDR
jgi:hypothetical protein